MRARLVCVLGLVLIVGWSAASESDIALSGKLTLFVPGREQGVFEKAGVKFEKQWPRVRVRFAEAAGVEPLAALADGSADIALLGRTLSPEEKDFTGTIVGWEGIALMVNASNRVMDVNLQQVKDLFSGKAKTWDELGGLESKIAVIHREEGKGVRPYLEQQLNMAGKLVNGKGIVEPDKEAVRVVSGSINAVSYINLSAGLSNVTVGVPVRLLSINKVEPEASNVSTGSYPLRRPIVMATKGEPSPLAKAFIDFMVGKEGQKTIQEDDFVPMLVTK